MSKITLPTEDIVALSSDEKNNILYEWIRRLPIESRSQFMVYCPSELLNYLQVQGVNHESHGVIDITYFGPDTSEEEVRGLCFILKHRIEIELNDNWFDLHLYFYNDNRVETGHLANLSKVDISEEEIIQEFKKYGFFDGNKAMTWAEAHAKIALLNRGGIPAVPTKDIVVLSSDETNNILYEWISRMPIQKGSRFTLYCNDKLLDYLETRGMKFENFRMGYLNHFGWWDEEMILKQTIRGFCFLFHYKISTSDGTAHLEIHFIFYNDGSVLTELLDSLSEDTEVEILKHYKVCGFDIGTSISWTEAYGIIAKINGSSIPPVPLE